MEGRNALMTEHGEGWIEGLENAYIRDDFCGV